MWWYGIGGRGFGELWLGVKCSEFDLCLGVFFFCYFA